jgi:hypothetical protein
VTESGIAPNECQLPCDTEPAPTRDPHLATDCPECGNGRICSPALCNRRRELHARLAESLRMLDGTSNVVSMAEARRARRR